MWRRKPVWNSAILEAGSSDPFDISAAIPLRVFSSRTLRARRKHIHTRADPFLFVDGASLYLFLETQAAGRLGQIDGYRTTDLQHFEELGPVLASEHHVSYPMIFTSGQRVHIVPETGSAGEVALYTFRDFPRGLERSRILLQGEYWDTSVIFVNGLWWFFTTSSKGLEIFYTKDLEAPLLSHAMNPISTDLSRCRCGGPIIEWEGSLYRPAQDATDGYGTNLTIMKIDELSQCVYRETPWREAIFDRSAAWRSAGAHHLSIVRFHGRTLLAVDGKQLDYRINRPLSLIARMLP